MKRTVDDDTKEIIESFIAEAYERLDEAEAKLEKLGGPEDREIFNAVFRLFHSVKGSAGFLNFERIKTLTHQAETLLDGFIKEGLPCTQEALDVVYTTIDLLRELIQTVEQTFADDGSAEKVDAQVAQLASLLASLRASKNAPQEPIPPLIDDRPPPPVRNRILLNDLVTRDMAERFVAESADLVERVERDALALENAADRLESVHSMFRAIHTIKGNAGFFGYGSLESSCRDLEGILDAARKGDTPLNDGFINTVLSRVDGIRSQLNSVDYVEEGSAEAEQEAVTADKTPSAGSPGSTTSGESEGSSTSGKGTSAKDAGATPSGIAEYKPIGEILVDLGAAPEDAVRKALETQEKPVGQLLVEEGIVKTEDVDRALQIQRSLGGPSAAPVEESHRREIRVDTVKLDKLFDLVGELITAEAMVYNSPELRGLKLDQFNKSFNALTKISREIQETSMMIRMIPLEGLFHKMSRLVRDLSRKFNKPVDFQISGEDTEMDKNVIEQISDPLVHIIRNALDHGLESPEERKKRGKSETGQVHLSARYEGSEIWVSIKDDGAGLNREKILNKAMEKGLITGDPNAISDKELWKFIFEPGFSTAQVVSDVSGRGVGMDVVKRNLEKIRGRVDVRTEGGKGTEFILQIPLTMAIIDGITIRIGEGFYSIPLSDILEFFKARPEQITVTEQGLETVNLRGQIMPLLKLGEIFQVPGALLEPTEGIILVVQSTGHRACLLIDEVIGNQQIVIKNLSEYLGKVEGLSGCSILGDGTVSFIIDTGRLIGLRLE
jgi:two-component system chemotaxis sensor kinase CheA